MDNPTPFETRESMQKSSRFRLPVITLIASLIVAAVGTYIWYYVYNACDADAVKNASAILVTQLDRYDHAYQFATSASRTSLDHPVSTLQQILLETKEVDVPACMRTTKNELLDYMGSVIRAFRAYGAQEADTTIRELLDQSDAHYANFTAELEAVKKCAPFCGPWD